MKLCVWLNMLTEVDLCNVSDELSEEDKKAELLPIAVQQIYVNAKLGRQDEAHRISKEVNPTEYDMPSLLAGIDTDSHIVSPTHPLSKLLESTTLRFRKILQTTLWPIA